MKGLGAGSTITGGVGMIGGITSGSITSGGVNMGSTGGMPGGMNMKSMYG